MRDVSKLEKRGEEEEMVNYSKLEERGEEEEMIAS
jgi:hypothetical protein